MNISFRTLIASCFLLVSTTILKAQVGIGTNSPHSSAQLEVRSNSKGILLPTVSLTGTNDNSTISSPATGLLVYNSNTVSGANGVTPGFYYFNSTAWVRLIIPSDNVTNVTGTIAIANGGTGATTASAARTNLGLGIGTDVLAPNTLITGSTKTKITYDQKGLVTAGADATTADIAPSTNRNYVTDAQLGVLSNTSGINSGDQTITLSGDVTGSGTGALTTTIGAGKVTNNMLAGSITDTKLNTISTAGKVANSATTGTASNTANALVLRDANGDFSAGTITTSGNLSVGTGIGDEGGEIVLAKAVTNTSLDGTGITIDSYQNRARIFEQGGNARGVYIDLSKAPAGVNGELTWKVSALVNAGTFIQLDNIKATVTSGVYKGLGLATASGTIGGYISGTFQLMGGNTGGAAASLSLSTTTSNSIFSWSFPGEGDASTYIVRDNTNSKVYRIILIIGGGYLNNFLSIERLH